MSSFPSADAAAVAAAALAAAYRTQRIGFDNADDSERAKRQYLDAYRFFLHEIAGTGVLREPAID